MQLDIISRSPVRLERKNDFASLSEFNCVANQIHDDLSQPPRIPQKRVRNIRRGVVGQFQPLLMCTEA